MIQWTNGAYEKSWTFVGMTVSEMPISVTLPTSHHFHPSLSPVVSLSLGILYEWVSCENYKSHCIPAPDANQAILEPPPENWRRPPGWPRTTWMKNIHDDLSSQSLDVRIREANLIVPSQWRDLCGCSDFNLYASNFKCQFKYNYNLTFRAVD